MKSKQGIQTVCALLFMVLAFAAIWIDRGFCYAYLLTLLSLVIGVVGLVAGFELASSIAGLAATIALTVLLLSGSIASAVAVVVLFIAALLMFYFIDAAAKRGNKRRHTAPPVVQVELVNGRGNHRGRRRHRRKPPR